MQYFRRMLKHKKLSTILLLGLLSRSLIAAGFMLDTNPTDGSLFTVILCEGPAGINAIAGLSDKNGDKNDEHAHHHTHHGNDDDNEHDHAAAQDHGFSACSFWSASAQSLAATQYLLNLSGTLTNAEVSIYQTPAFQQNVKHARFARAPPLLLS